MQAVILAAGTGKRLMPITNEIPKSMVEIDGIPIIIRALDNLSNTGKITEAIIIVGHKKEKIIERIGNSYHGIKIVYVDVPEYEKTNNIYGLWLARDYIKEDFILLEGDIVLEQKVLTRFLDERKDKALVARYDISMDGTVVTIDKDTNRIGKFIPKSQQEINFDFSDKYKTINIYFFTKEFWEQFKPALDFNVKNTGRNSYYELVLGTLVYMGIPIYADIIDEDLKWYEIDDHVDLEIANNMFEKNKLNSIVRLYRQSGGYWRYNFLDFCYLHNLYFPTKHMYDKIAKKLPLLINKYPSSSTTISKLLSRWYKEDNFSEENLIVGHGACELIRILNKNIVKKITVPIPSFLEYESKLGKEQITYVQLDEKDNFKVNKDKFIETVRSSGSDFAVIVNPNNPTAQIESREDIEYILKSLPEVNIIVDESFIDFSNAREKYSVQDLVGKYKNLLLIRSLSKEFGVPGLRLGYLLTTNSEIKKKIREHLPLWNINSIAEEFIEMFVRHEKEYHESIKEMVKEREYLLERLKEINYLHPLPSSANFILCKSDINSFSLFCKLYQKDILAKDCSNKNGLEQDKYIRLSVRTKHDTDKLIIALKDINK